MKVVNGWKEYAVGERFVLGNIEYICLWSTAQCSGCDFLNENGDCPNDVSCNRRNRSDGESVIFKRTGKCIESKKKTEFAVGEEFECGLKTLRCMAIDANSPEKTCKGCVFYVDMACTDYLDFTGYCSEEYRSDGTEVIFIEVKPENKEK